MASGTRFHNFVDFAASNPLSKAEMREPPTLIARSVLSLVTLYRSKAHQRFLDGRRSYFLSCEQDLGAHCAKLFERDLAEVAGMKLLKVGQRVR